MLLSYPLDLAVQSGFQREYIGVLMSSKHSKNFICVSIGAKGYKSKTAVRNRQLSGTVRLHPAELKCDSLHCESSKDYSDRYRVRCVVVTI